MIARERERWNANKAFWRFYTTTWQTQPASQSARQTRKTTHIVIMVHGPKVGRMNRPGSTWQQHPAARRRTALHLWTATRARRREKQLLTFEKELPGNETRVLEPTGEERKRPPMVIRLRKLKCILHERYTVRPLHPSSWRLRAGRGRIIYVIYMPNRALSTSIHSQDRLSRAIITHSRAPPSARRFDDDGFSWNWFALDGFFFATLCV